MNPNECELCVKPIQHKEKNFFRVRPFLCSASLPGVDKFVEPRSCGTAKPPNHWPEVPPSYGRNETRFVLPK